MSQIDLQDRLNNELVVVPRAPEELRLLCPTVDLLFGHAKTVKILRKSELCGLVVADQSGMLSDHTQLNEGSTNDQNSPEKSTQSFGCVFIPAPQLDRVIIFKSVTNLSKDDSFDQINDSIANQLIGLNKIIAEANQNPNSQPDSFDIQLIVSSRSNIRKNVKFKELKNLINNQKTPTNIKMNVNFEDENAIGNKIKSLLKHNFQPRAVIRQLVSTYLKELPNEQCYQLSSQKIKLLNNQPSTIGDINETLKLFDFYFPNRQNKLETVPHFNQLTDQMLYSYTEQGELGELHQYASYMGEVRLFSEQLLAKFKNPCGVLLKNFSSEHLKNVLDLEKFAPQQFEIDWIHLGSRHITAIEVGMTENPGEPKSALSNKIMQCITKTVPHMMLMLYSLWVEYELRSHTHRPPDTENFAAVIGDLMKCIIFIPGLTSEFLAGQRESIEKTIRENCDNDMQTTQMISFLVQNEHHNDKLKLVKLNEELQVIDDPITVDTIFSKTESTSNDILCYFSALMSISSLNVMIETETYETKDHAIDVDQRYFSPFKKWVKNQKKTDRNPNINDSCISFVLSPQQHRILLESKPHLIITGQPGSGKTALLLAMCEKMAKLDDVDEINFIFDERCTLYGKYLQKMLQQSGLDRRIKPRGIDTTSSSFFFDTIEKKERQVLMIDEIQSEDSFWTTQRCAELSKFKCCWISFTEYGQLGEGEIIEVPNNFQHEDLKILFRSSSHISALTHDNIERFCPGLPFSFKPVKVPGCFTAAQREIAVKYVDTVEQLLDVRPSDDFLDKNMNNRLVVIKIAKEQTRGLNMDQLKTTWNASEIIQSSIVSRSISGSEFKSVLLIAAYYSDILDFETFSVLLNGVLSRAQYEAGIIFIRDRSLDTREFDDPDKTIEDTFSAYKSMGKEDHVVLFAQMMSNPPTNKGWLQTNDATAMDSKLEWWRARLRFMLSKDNENTINHLKRQSTGVRLQIVCALSNLFELVLHSSGETSENNDGNQNSFVLKLSNSSDQSVFLSLEEVYSLDDETVCSLNLLYWSLWSKGIDALAHCIELLHQRNLLSKEFNKKYPNKTVLTMAVDLLEFNKIECATLRFLLEDVIRKKSTLPSENIILAVLHYILDNKRSAALFILLTSVPAMSDVYFMEYLGFQEEEGEQVRIGKYRETGTWMLESVMRMLSREERTQTSETFQLALELLQIYNVLDYELNQIDNRAFLKWVAVECASVMNHQIVIMVRLLKEAACNLNRPTCKNHWLYKIPNLPKADYVEKNFVVSLVEAMIKILDEGDWDVGGNLLSASAMRREYFAFDMQYLLRIFDQFGKEVEQEDLDGNLKVTEQQDEDTDNAGSSEQQ